MNCFTRLEAGDLREALGIVCFDAEVEQTAVALELLSEECRVKDGWQRTVRVINPTESTVVTTVGIRIDADLTTELVEWNHHQKYQSRMTVLWTDTMIRFRQVNSRYELRETCVSWNRHAEVRDEGRLLQFPIHLDGYDQLEIEFKFHER